MMSRPARVLLALAVACMASMVGVYRTVAEAGFNTSSVLPPILAFLLTCGIAVGVLAWVRKGNAWRDAAGLAHDGPKTTTLLAIVAGGVALIVLVGVVAPKGGVNATAPSPELRVDGRRVTSHPLGLSLDLPADWERVDVPPEAGIFLRHAPTGTAFGAFAMTRDRPSSLDATLQVMLDEKRVKYGAIEDVSWGEDHLGKLIARTVAFTAVVGPGVSTRLLTWTATSGPYAVGFTCSGPSPTFAASEAKCRSVLGPIAIEPR